MHLDLLQSLLKSVAISVLLLKTPMRLKSLGADTLLSRHLPMPSSLFPTTSRLMARKRPSCLLQGPIWRVNRPIFAKLRLLSFWHKLALLYLQHVPELELSTNSFQE